MVFANMAIANILVLIVVIDTIANMAPSNIIASLAEVQEFASISREEVNAEYARTENMMNLPIFLSRSSYLTQLFMK